MHFLLHTITESSEVSGIDMSLLAAVLAAVISAAAAITIAIMNHIHRKRELQDKKLAERRIFINKKLNELYGPMYSYLNVIKAIHTLFKVNKPKKFRLLLYLMDENQFYETEHGKIKVTLTKSDHQLINEIIELEKNLENLIIEKGGLIDDPDLTFKYIPESTTNVEFDKEELGLLPMAITHFRIIRLAYNGHFKGENERFKDFVYPKELDKKIKERIESLQSEIEDIS